MNITEISYEDAAEIAQIEAQVHISPWSKQAIITSLESGQLGYKVVKNETIVAYCFIYVLPDALEVLNIAVAKPFQRQGLGGDMIKFIYNKARAIKKNRILLEARKSNKPAQGLYLKHGFVQKGIRKNYYSMPSSKEDALLYHVELDRVDDLILGI